MELFQTSLFATPIPAVVLLPTRFACRNLQLSDREKRDFRYIYIYIWLVFFCWQGRFEILSLSGTFMETENQGSRGRSGGMSVSLAGPDGRVVGGGVAGLLIAATPIQVTLESFQAFIFLNSSR